MKLHKGLVVTAMFLIGALLLAACGGNGGSGSSSGSGQTDPRAVRALSDTDAAPYLEIAGPPGYPPCGVFDVLGHGEKTVQVREYAGCAGRPLGSIACLNDQAQWTTDAVSNVAVAGDGRTISFTSGQEGLCAIFPAPSD